MIGKSEGHESRPDDSPQPLFFTRKAFEGKNSEIREHHYPDGSRHVVTRLGARKGGFSFEEAHKLAEHVSRYHRELTAVGIEVPPLHGIYVEYDPSIDRSVVVKTSPWVGNEVYSLLKEYTADQMEEMEALVRAIAEITLKLAATTEGNWHTSVGIDPHCSNFVRDTEGKIWYVDLFPPRVRNDGEALVEWPEPKDDLGKIIGHFKHFDVRGMVLTQTAQLARIRPELKAVFEGWVHDTLEKVISESAFAHFVKEFEKTPWMRLRTLLENPKENKAEILDLIQSAVEEEVFGIPYNVYTLREIALELTRSGLMTIEELDLFFRDSHFEDTLPEEVMKNLVSNLEEKVTRNI